MNVQQILTDSRKIQQMINRKWEKHDYYMQMSYSIPGPCYGGDHVQHMRNLDAPFVKWLDKAFDVEAEIRELQTEMEENNNRIQAMVNETITDAGESYALVAYYCYLKTKESIAEFLKISVRAVSGLLRKGQERLEVKYESK